MRRPEALLTSLVALAALLATACTKPAEGPPPTSGAPVPAAKNQINSKDVIPADGVFRIGLRANPPALDPILISDTTSDGVASKIFDALLGYDEQLTLVPKLVEAMPEISEGGVVYTFKLKPGIKFHDGHVLVAADVKYSLSRLALTQSKRFNLVEPIVGATEAAAAARAGKPIAISGITVIDDQSFSVRLVKPMSVFLYYLAMVCTAPVHEAAVVAKGDMFSRAPIGSGSFKLAEWVENDHLKLEPFPEYHGGAPKLKGILLRIIPEALARQEEYMAGNLELIDVVSGMYTKWRESNHPKDVVEWQQMGILYYGFNMDKPGSPYAGRTDEKARKLRQALNLTVDREHICKNVLEDRYVPANGILPAGMPGQDTSRPAFKKDVVRAKQLLAEAGYPDGKGLASVELFFNTQGDEPRIAAAVQADLTEAGIPVTLKALDWAAHIEACDKGEPAFFRLGWVADYPDPENYLAPLFHSRNRGPQGNVSFYSNPEVDALIDQSYVETDQAKRLALLRQAEELILADSPWLFLTSQKDVVLLKPYVTNFHPGAMDDDVNASSIAWERVEMLPQQ